MTDNKMAATVLLQLESLFGIDSSEREALLAIHEKAESKTIYGLLHSTNKYFSHCKENDLNPLHSVMHCIYCYWLSRLAFLTGATSIADKIYYLNKAMNGVELFYEVNMPDIWGCDHPLGAVMGRAEFGDYFSFIQGCTVGNNKGVYPVIGNHVSMLSHSKILGKSHIGNHVILSANSYVKDEDIPDYSIVFGMSPHLVIKENKLPDLAWKDEI